MAMGWPVFQELRGVHEQAHLPDSLVKASLGNSMHLPVVTLVLLCGLASVSIH